MMMIRFYADSKLNNDNEFFEGFTELQRFVGDCFPNCTFSSSGGPATGFGGDFKATEGLFSEEKSCAPSSSVSL